MDPPFDLEWLHNLFAWTAEHVGLILLLLFGATIVLLPITTALVTIFNAGRAALNSARTIASAVPVGALAAVPVLAVGWFVLTQIAALIAPFLGMYHGEATPAVP
ncbi:MAG TPA: hypothetical protein VGX25_04915 [Actinophytocola sp.]|uniref:hypothetical protein n=1 Tax=Actinophytocola sp. TaxID=1872138 RepID=UPI002DDCE384|nr:hypothetical protein [Actinophytocola sp.]HEV2778723.1 hypothetical protein [Actinophytocola sp.]